MMNAELWAGALSLVLQHAETGCGYAARQASSLLERLSDAPEVDGDTRLLCERASLRLGDAGRAEHVPAA